MNTEITGTTVTACGDDGQWRLDRVTTICHSANYARRHLEHTVLLDARLTWTSYEVLHLAVMHRPIDTGTLAAIANVSKGTVTRAAAALVRRGLLHRSNAPGDRRRALLTPTPTGWALNQQLRAGLIQEITRLFDASVTADIHNVAVLRRLVAAPTQTGASQ